MTGAQQPGSFRLAYVPGVTPDKWVRIWRERLPRVRLDPVTVGAGEAEGALREGAAHVALLRLPIDRTGLSAIPLYTETSVVVVPKDHEVAAVDEVALVDLTDYVVLRPLDDPLEWRQSPPGRPAPHRPADAAEAIELVAAGAGLLVVPQSLARLHHRKDLTYRPVPDAPGSRVALCWLEDQTTDLVEEFIGIVRGRTVNSSRGRGGAPVAGRERAGDSTTATGRQRGPTGKAKQTAARRGKRQRRP